MKKTFKVLLKLILGIIFAAILLFFVWVILMLPKNKTPPPDEFNGTYIKKYPEHGIAFYKSELNDFSWAPDSKRMAGILWPLRGNNVVYASTSDELAVTDEELTVTEIYLWDIEDNLYRNVSNKDFDSAFYQPKWNPAYETIIFSCYMCDEFDMSGFGTLNLTTNEFTDINSKAQFWFPDGKRLLTNDFEIIDLESNVLESFQFEFEGAKNLRLKSLSPNGNYIIITNYTGGGKATFHLFTIDTQELWGLWDQEIDTIGWTNDSDWVISYDYYGNDDEEDIIFAINLRSKCFTDGLYLPSDIQRAEFSESYELDFAWSPDGKTFAISGELEGVGRGIFLIDTDSDLIQDWLSSGTCGEE